MDWIYLSPHLDDAVLSCGGLIASQTRAGERVTILTLCAGEPPEGQLPQFAQMLHAQWGLGRDTVSRRRAEDRLACEFLGAESVYLSVPDCIYRRSPLDGRLFYDSEAAIFGPPDPEEGQLVQELSAKISSKLPVDVTLVSPLSIGGHVDHRITRAAAESLSISLWYYADYPYVELDTRWLSGQPGEGEAEDWTSRLFPFSGDELSRWQEAVAAYRSQWPVFWANADSMAGALAAYQHRFGGVLLWKKTLAN